MKKGLLIFLLFCLCRVFAQKDTLPYNRKAEIVYDNKRYRKYNNYLTFGLGKGYSSVRTTDQTFINVDFQFHLQKQYFQLGFFLSGNNIYNRTNLQGHICYGWRYEKEKFNLGVYGGPSYSYLVTGTLDTAGVLHVNSQYAFGGYAAIQAIYKIKYDVGLGLEVFGDISDAQKQCGLRVICFFSGAYRGEHRGFKTKKK